MADKSQFFRVAVEGGTTDGRIIERGWLEEMAATYNPVTYGARVNMEHIKGFSADPPFCAYGDVIALKTETIDLDVGGKTEKRLALFAQIDPTEDLVKLNARRQKVYTSIEVEPNFRGTGKAYLMGLAVTDNPASLGTEMLAFAAQSPAIKAMFDGRKSAPTALFTAAIETQIVFEAPQQPTQSAADAAVQFLRQIFGSPQATAGQPTGGAQAAPANPAGGSPSPAPAAGGDQFSAATAFGQVQAALMGLGAQIDAGRQTDDARFGKLEGELATLKATLEKTPEGGQHSAQRPAATGGGGHTLTDC